MPKLRAVTHNNPDFVMPMRIAQWAASGTLPDSTGGATHYHTVNILPAWAVVRGPTTIIGRQVFYRIVS